jgi:LmbE family N-acetylglucosaminyl deacetylase
MSVKTMGPSLDGVGTPETVWADAALNHLPPLELRDCHRAVLVAPHPDDEVLAAGGLIQRLSGQRVALSVVGVTDGEASHRRSPTITPNALADLRTREREQALRHLGVNARICRLGLPDGAVVAPVEELLDCLRPMLAPGVVCVAPWEHDGHPDHDATGDAVAAACAETGAVFLRTLVWTWHWAFPGDPSVPWERARRLTLNSLELTRKRWAVRAFASQTGPLSDRPGDEAILSPAMLARFERPDEVFLA